MKLFYILFIFSISLYANNKDTTKNTTLLEDISNIIPVKLDSNLSNKINLQHIKEYLKTIKFNDKFNKKKLNYNLMSYKENYILLGGYTNNNLVQRHWTNGIEDTYNTDGTFDKGYERDKNEAQYQISIKIPLFQNFLSTHGDLYTAYTQNSYWQVYNTAHSSPFRETNYMPELFVQWDMDKKIGDSILKQIRFGFAHQSNGQDIGSSRSWNRTEIYFLFQKHNYSYGINLWDRWNEEQKNPNDPNYPNITKGDDNPNLEKYIGKQRYFIRYKQDRYSIALYHQNQMLHYDINKGNTKLDITFPSLNTNLDFFIRYFTGYGESLIDYDVKINRISFGIMIANWN